MQEEKRLHYYDDEANRKINSMTLSKLEFQFRSRQTKDSKDSSRSVSKHFGGKKVNNGLGKTGLKFEGP